MVQIKKYEQQVDVAAGGLGPRASGAFEAPGKALAGLGAKVDQVAFDFLERQKAAETKRVQDEEFTNFSQEADDFNRNNKDTDTEVYQQNFKAFRDQKLNAIDARTDLTKSQKDKVKQSLSSTALSFQFKGENAAFGRGQAIRTEASKAKLGEMIRQASVVPENHPDRRRLEAEIDLELKNNIVDGIRTGYDSDSIKQGFKAIDLGKQIDAAASIDELDNLAETIPGKGMADSTQERFKNRVKARKREMRGLAYDQAIGDIDALSVSAADQEGLQDAIMNGKPFVGVTDDGQQKVINTADLTNGQRMALVRSVADPKFKDLVDLTQQNAVDDITESEDPLSMFQSQVSNPEDRETRDIELGALEAAEQMSQAAQNGLATGDMTTEEVTSMLARTEQLLQSEVSPNGALSKRADKFGDAAQQTLSRVAKVRTALAKSIKTESKRDVLRDAAKNGTLLNASNQPDLKASTDDVQAVVNENLDALKDSPQKQLDFLQKNGVTSQVFTDTLVKHKGRLSDPNKTDIDDEDRFAITLFRNMEMREDLLNKHLNAKDLAWWRSFETLSDVYGDEDALQQMRLQRDIDPEAFSKELDRILDVTDAQLTRQPWYKFDLDSPQNTGYMKQEIKDLAKEYIKQGVGVDKALERAGEDLARSHTLIGSVLVPNLPEFDQGGELSNIEQIATLVIDDFAETNKQMLEDAGLDKGNIGLLNIEGTADRFYLVRDGGFPIQNSEGKYMSYTKEELMKLGPDAAKLAADNSLQSVNDALGRKGAQLERAENVEEIDAFDVETIN
jgi:hypothetical protein